MIILLQEPGTTVRKHSQMIKIDRAGKIQEVAVKKIESVLVQSRVHITHSALILLAQHGIPVIYLRGQKPIASFIPFAYHGFVQTRRAQFAAYANVIGIKVIHAMISGAIRNKARMCRYYARNRRKSKPELADHISKIADKISALPERLTDTVESIIDRYNQPRFTQFEKDIGQYPYQRSHIGECRDQIMALEGRAARLYFSAIARILPPALDFMERNRRPPKDPVNAALSFGYHLLEKEILTAIITAGLEPYAGFLHSDRSGRPSLVYDLIEEFRQPIVDRLVIRLFQHQLLQPDDFRHESAGSGVKFTEDALQKFLGEFYYMIRKDGIKEHNYFYTYQRCILRQARRLVRYLTMQSAEYTPYQFVW